MTWTEARPGARWGRPGRSSPPCRCETHYRLWCFCHSLSSHKTWEFVKTGSGRTQGNSKHGDHHRACSQIRPIMDVLWTQSVMPDNTEHLPFRKYLLRGIPHKIAMSEPFVNLPLYLDLCMTSICSSEQVHRPRAHRRPAHLRPGVEIASFSNCYTINEHFTKTGSGQTWYKS